MKKLLFKLGLGLIFLAFLPIPSKAQVSVNINIGAQPLWGPIGYVRVDYYYLPDIDSYYYVPSRQFVYLSNGQWVFGASLPIRYRNYDLYRGYKVVINQPRPYLNYKYHRVKYKGYKGYNGRQPVIRYSNNPRYYVVKGHPKHSVNQLSYYRNDDRGRNDYYKGGKGGYKTANNGKGKGGKGGKN